MPLRRLLIAAFLTYRRYACEICNSHPAQIHLVILRANYTVLPYIYTDLTFARFLILQRFFILFL